MRFSQRKKARQTDCPYGLPACRTSVLPSVQRNIFYGYRLVFPLIEPNALFDLLHTDRLAFFYKDMDFTVPNRPNQPDQFLLLGGQFYALFCLHTSPDFLLHPDIDSKGLPCIRPQGGRIQSAMILQAGARGVRQPYNNKKRLRRCPEKGHNITVTISTIFTFAQ